MANDEGLDWDLIGRLNMGTMSSWTGDEHLHPGARESIERHMSLFTKTQYVHIYIYISEYMVCVYIYIRIYIDM